MNYKCAILALACWLACIPALLAQQQGPAADGETAAAEAAPRVAQAEQPGGQESSEVAGAADPSPAPPEHSARSGERPPDRTFTLGLGVGVINVPGEQSFSGDTPATTLFTDLYFGRWAQFRIGVGQYSATLGESALTTQTLDLIYMVGGQFVAPLEAYVLLGVSQVSSTLEVADAGQSVTSAGMGNLFGGMLVYRLGSLRLGGQLIVISHTGDFEGVAIADGSSQVQLVAAFDWF